MADEVEVKIVNPDERAPAAAVSAVPEAPVSDNDKAKAKVVNESEKKQAGLQTGLRAKMEREKLSITGIQRDVNDPKKREALGNSLPAGKMTEMYRTLAADTNLPEGQLKSTLLAIFALMAKYGAVFGNMKPGGFMEDLKRPDSPHKDDNFSSKDLENLINKSAKTPDMTKLQAYGKEAASVSYVCSKLGVEEILSAKSLAARLAHFNSGVDGKPYYSVARLNSLKATGKPKEGTVICFVTSMFDPEITVAIANKDGQFEYVEKDPKSGAVTEKKSSLSDLLKTDLMLKAGFIPRVAKAPAPTPANPVETAEMNMEKRNNGIKEVEKLKKEVEDNFKAGKVDDLKSAHANLLKMREAINILHKSGMKEKTTLEKMLNDTVKLASFGKSAADKLKNDKLAKEFTDLIERFKKAKEKLNTTA